MTPDPDSSALHRTIGNGGGMSASRVVATLPLDIERDMPRRARRLVGQALQEAGLDRLADDAVLVAGELVTNALLHGGLPAELVVRVGGAGTARLEMADASPALPLRARRDDTAMTGRGLSLVEALAGRWGVQRLERGKVVWAELSEHLADTGTQVIDAAADTSALLGGWPDLQPPDATDPGPELYTVYLGEVPVDLLLAAKAHVDNVVREFSLAAAGARAGTASALPGHLTELIDAVVHRFAAPREAIKRQALLAAGAGRDHVRLELTLPASAADAAEVYLRALDRADDYCRAARLLTLESPPQHRVFRRWYVEGLVSQLRRAEAGLPQGTPQTFEQRLLLELDVVALAERKAERGARLFALSSALASAVTSEAVTEAVLGEGVQALRASGGAILMASADRGVLVPGSVGYGEEVVGKLRAQSQDVELPAAVALRTCQPVWLETPEERNRRFPELVGMEPTTVSMCAVPLMVSGRCLGALRFSFPEARLFDGEERAFVLAMAAQTAQALDRARLYARRADTWDALRHTLRPPPFPEIPGLRVRLVRPHVEDDLAGGFCDVWPAGDGRWAFAVGQAAGTWPEAAATAVLLPHTLRALTLHETAVGTVLEGLDRVLRATSPGERSCTVVFGLLDVGPRRALVELGGGGHTDPLLVRGTGERQVIEVSGSPVGSLDRPAFQQRTVELGVGDEVVLATGAGPVSGREDHDRGRGDHAPGTGGGALVLEVTGNPTT